MIIFHEGLPRSGKSYEAMVKHVLEALRNGRKVFAYVKGLNHEKIAEIIEKPVEYVREMLVYIEPEKVPAIYDHVENDSLVIIDELQNFFPSGRQKLDDKMMLFVTEHGHRGLDIITMGQDLRDCHNLWKRRTQRKVVFTKLSAVGAENRYSWTMYEAPRPERFVKVSSGTGKYDSQYFGIYKSHDEGTSNFGNFKDSRANLFKTPGVKYGIPAAVFAAVYAVYFLVGFFNGDSGFAAASGGQSEQRSADVSSVDETPRLERRSQAQRDFIQARQAEREAAAQEERQASDIQPIDYLDRIANEYRFRLAGIIDGPDGQIFGRVDALDSTMRLKERFTLRDIRALGWTVERFEYGLLISKRDPQTERTVQHVVRPWPIDPFGRVSQAQQQRL